MFATAVQNFFAFFSALAGAFLATRLALTHRQLCGLIGFAAGMLFGVTAVHILPEAWETLSKPALILALASGYAVFFIVNRYVAHICPACSASHFEEKHPSGSPDRGLLLLAAALGIHSLMDGLAIAMGENHAGSRPVFFTIAIHKFPEGFALCTLLLKAGYQKIRALVFSGILEAATLAGWIVGAFLLTGLNGSSWMDAILVHAGGGFVFLALHATLNEARKHSPLLPCASFLAGLIFIALVR